MNIAKPIISAKSWARMAARLSDRMRGNTASASVNASVCCKASSSNNVWTTIASPNPTVLFRHSQRTRLPRQCLALAIFVCVYAFNMLGDALRDVLDPRLRGGR